MTIKVGQEYFSLNVNDETAAHEWWIYRVRTIQKRNGVLYAYAIMVDSWTWGKRSTKAGDYGWLDPIPEWCRKKFRVEIGPSDIFKTKKAAIKHELKLHVEHMQPEDYDDPEMFDKIKTKLENMLKRA